MRVEFISPYEHDPKTGIGRYVHTLAEHLNRHIDAEICRPRFLPLANRFNSLRILPIGIEDHVPGSIVHIPQIMGCAMMLYRSCHPSVATVHDLGYLEFPEEWEMFDPIARQMLRLSLAGLERVDLLLVHSDRTRVGLVRHLGIRESAIIKVPSSIDTSHFRPLHGARRHLESKYGFDFEPGRAYLLYVGSELPRKNVGLLLQILAILKQRGHKVTLIKVGGPGGSKWRDETLLVATQYNCLEELVFAGFVPEVDLPYFYNASDICVTTTKLEGGFAWLAMEGMACGRPVVASVNALIPDEAAEAAVVVDNEDPTHFADAIEALIADEGLREWMGARGVDLVADNTWDAEAVATLAAYNNL